MSRLLRDTVDVEQPPSPSDARWTLPGARKRRRGGCHPIRIGAIPMHWRAKGMLQKVPSVDVIGRKRRVAAE